MISRQQSCPSVNECNFSTLEKATWRDLQVAFVFRNKRKSMLKQDNATTLVNFIRKNKNMASGKNKKKISTLWGVFKLFMVMNHGCSDSCTLVKSETRPRLTKSFKTRSEK